MGARKMWKYSPVKEFPQPTYRTGIFQYHSDKFFNFYLYAKLTYITVEGNIQSLRQITVLLVNYFIIGNQCSNEVYLA